MYTFSRGRLSFVHRSTLLKINWPNQKVHKSYDREDVGVECFVLEDGAAPVFLFGETQGPPLIVRESRRWPSLLARRTLHVD